jgi:hypothetical protein
MRIGQSGDIPEILSVEAGIRKNTNTTAITVPKLITAAYRQRIPALSRFQQSSCQFRGNDKGTQNVLYLARHQLA